MEAVTGALPPGRLVPHWPGSFVQATEPHVTSGRDISNNDAPLHTEDHASGPDSSPGSFVLPGSLMPPSATALELSEPSRPVTHLQHNIRKPNIYTNGTVRYACLFMSREPESTTGALSHDKWWEAMNNEYQALMKNKTWHLVPSHHASNVIDCK
jgi:hypothetical protein